MQIQDLDYQYDTESKALAQINKTNQQKVNEIQAEISALLQMSEESMQQGYAALIEARSQQQLQAESQL